jgi:hypothetical protein
VDAHTFTRQAEKVNKCCLPARKLMAAVFWDRKGVLIVEFMQQGTTMSEAYCRTLEELCTAGHSEQKAWNADIQCMLLRNERLHAAACTRVLLEHFNWELFDLALSDYHLFTYLKKWLGSQYINKNEELMEGVKTWLNSQTADFFDTGIQKLIPQYN